MGYFVHIYIIQAVPADKYTVEAAIYGVDLVPFR